MDERDLGLGELETVRITDRLSPPVEITGTKIGHIDTREGAPEQSLGRPRRRWGVNRVWRLRSGGYVLAREAYSVIYHTNPTTCLTRNGLQSGDPADVDELPDEAYPCWACKPPYPEALDDGGKPVRFEFPRRTIDQCSDPGQVVYRLTNSRKFSGILAQEIPEPTRALLEQCRDHDPDFADAEMPVQRIS
jgi:hypothetical protein